jgi:hypothetical protein
MSSPLAPSRTSEQAPPPLHNGRRSFTVPARLRSSPAPAPAFTSIADGIETLVVCPHSRIVSFAAAGTSAASAGDEIAWTTPTERTLAVGMSCLSRRLLPQVTRAHRCPAHIPRDSIQRILPQLRQPPAHYIPSIAMLVRGRTVGLRTQNQTGFILSYGTAFRNGR